MAHHARELRSAFSEVLAAMWLDLAAMAKHGAAAEALASMELTEEQRARARRLAKAWH